MSKTKIEITAFDIANRVRGHLEGDGSRAVRGIETLDNATSDMLSWVGSPDYALKVAKSQAGVLLLPPDLDSPPGKTVILVADPDLAMCDVLKMFAPPQDSVEQGIHPSAVIGRDAVVDNCAIGPQVFVGINARIGEGSVLYSGVSIGRDTHIGRNCVLWPNVVVREGVTIGNNVIIHANSTIGADGFSYIQREGRHVRVPQIGTVVIEDDVEIGANTTIDRARSGATRVRRGTKIDNLVMVAHNCDIGEGSLLAALTGIAGSTKLGKYVVCGGQAGIIDHLDVGDGVQIGANSCVLNDIPAGQLVRGTPAREVTRFGREHIALRKLPELLKKLKELERRIAELESLADSSRN